MITVKEREDQLVKEIDEMFDYFDIEEEFCSGCKLELSVCQCCKYCGALTGESCYEDCTVVSI